MGLPTEPLRREVFDRFGTVWLVRWREADGYWDHVSLTMEPNGYRLATIRQCTPGGCISDPRYSPARAREAASAHDNQYIAAALREAADIAEAWESDGALPDPE